MASGTRPTSWPAWPCWWPCRVTSARPRSSSTQGKRSMEELGESVWLLSFHYSYVAMWQDDPVTAEHELRPAYEALKRTGEKSHFSSMAHGLAHAVYTQGRYDEAEQLTRECEEACRPNDVHSHVMWRATRAKVLARRRADGGGPPSPRSRFSCRNERLPPRSRRRPHWTWARCWNSAAIEKEPQQRCRKQSASMN